MCVSRRSGRPVLYCLSNSNQGMPQWAYQVLRVVVETPDASRTVTVKAFPVIIIPCFLVVALPHPSCRLRVNPRKPTFCNRALDKHRLPPARMDQEADSPARPRARPL